MQDPDLEAVRAALAGRRPGEHRLPCPRCARQKARSRDDALAVKVEPDGSGTFLCHRCGWRAGWRSNRAEWRSRSWVRPEAAPPALKAEPNRDRDRLRDAIVVYWSRARPITPGSVAAEYLRRRGCRHPLRLGELDPDWPVPEPWADGHLRWAQAQRHPSGWRGPCLVALVTDAVTAKPLTIHRTWLAPDGSGKAPLDKCKLLWPGLAKRHGVVRIWPDDEVTLGLAIAEGIETALAFAQVFAPVWACIDAGNLAQFPVLDGIEALTICADHDDAGLRAAETCARRWYDARREVRIFAPGEDGKDFADVTRELLA